MARHATIDAYIDALAPPLAGIARAARAAIDAGLPEAESAIKWAHPTWSLGKQPVCYLKAASAHVTFGFWQGASIDDPSDSPATRARRRSRSRTGASARARLGPPQDVDRRVDTELLGDAHAAHRLTAFCFAGRVST